MLPDHVLSTEPIAAQFNFPRNIPKRPLLDYEFGGVDLNDATEGLQVKVWKGEYIEGQVVLSASGVAPVAVLTIAGLKDFSFTFDQNMRVAVAYELEAGGSHFYWYDTTISAYTTLNLAAGTITPLCCLDDKRELQIPSSDIILAYCRAGALYFREQRDRYQTEYLLHSAVGDRGLIQIGMNRVWRMQFMIATPTV